MICIWTSLQQMSCVSCPNLRTTSQGKRDISNNLQQIQVERLTVSVVAFIVTVDLIALRGIITDVAKREQYNVVITA